MLVHELLCSNLGHLGSQESHQLFNKAMKLGHVDANIGKMLIYGACGTGKSTFIDLLVANSPKSVRRSTPLATRPMTVFQCGVTKKQWTKLSPEERKALLVKVTMHYQAQLNQEEESESGEKNVSGEVHTSHEGETEQHHVHVNNEGKSTPSIPSTRDTQPRVQSVAAPKAPTMVMAKQALLQPISSYDDMVSLVQQCSITGEAITSYRKILLIDSGGQPQFHEILPVFLRRMSLYVFVFKLSDELDSKPLVEYYHPISGELLGKPYRSAHTHLQLLQHCLRTLHTHRSSSKDKIKSSRIMIVGTHLDLEHECKGETREEKERKLMKLLKPEFRKKAVYYDLSTKKYIFPLNAKNPQSEDKILIKSIQDIVTTECSPEPVNVPLQYFALEIVLEDVSQKLGRGVLSIEECLEAAAGLHFDKHTLGAALEFLDELSVLFYFPEDLEGVVFVNPQVLLDKATELVEQLYKLQEGNISQEKVGEWQVFMDYSRFDLEFLKRPEFSKHYLPGLFTEVELVKLFNNKLLVFANYRDNEFFMPALLRVLSDEEMSKFCVPCDSPAAPIALDFPLGAPRLGVFCALCCFLVSSSNQIPGPWEIKLDPDSDLPVCLSRNCIRFSVPKYSGHVTLVDTFTHFQVHVWTRKKENYKKMCAKVRDCVKSGVTTVTRTLGYADCIPSVEFVCPCKKGIPHVAKVGDNNDWICERDSVVSETLDERYLVWELEASRQQGEILR